MNPTRRRCPRYWFNAPGEVATEGGTSFPVTLMELSLYGCYLDTETPLATKSQVLLKVFGNGEVFEARASVIYANPSFGMGLVFRDVRPQCHSILQKWLLMAMEAGKQSASADGAEQN
jgi:PilZ domain